MLESLLNFYNFTTILAGRLEQLKIRLPQFNFQLPNGTELGKKHDVFIANK